MAGATRAGRGSRWAWHMGMALSEGGFGQGARASEILVIEAVVNPRLLSVESSKYFKVHQWPRAEGRARGARVCASRAWSLRAYRLSGAR